MAVVFGRSIIYSHSPRNSIISIDPIENLILVIMRTCNKTVKASNIK